MPEVPPVHGPVLGERDRRDDDQGERLQRDDLASPRHDQPPPLQVLGSGSGAGGRRVKSTRSCDESTTVTPSGKLRFWPSTCGACGAPPTNCTIDTRPQPVDVSELSFSSAE